MNIHAPPKEIRDHFKCVEFVGKRFTRNGKTYIRARHKFFNVIMFYCFNDNFIWFVDDCKK